MTYEEFKQVWSDALRESGLGLIGVDPVHETLDLRAMDRKCESFVEPRPQDVEPFHVSASLSWQWNALHAARTRTTEEDMLTELLGRESSSRRTERPWLRVDVELGASLPWGQAMPMPPREVWSAWTAEAIGRLEAIEPIVPARRMRDGRDGLPEILAWQGEPVARVICGLGGELRLEAVKIAAWQAIELPRIWSDSSRQRDPWPGEQLAAMFARVRAALLAWTEATDHLRGSARR